MKRGYKKNIKISAYKNEGFKTSSRENEISNSISKDTQRSKITNLRILRMFIF